MDKFQEAAQYYKENLENKEFLIKAGKKQNTIEMVLKFDANNFKHLLGLHKLKDLPIHNNTSVYIYKQALDGDLTYEQISKSDYFKDIEPRFKYFSYIKEIVLTSKILQKSRKGMFYSIKADILITKNIDLCFINIFGKKLNKDDVVVPVSFFPSDTPHYYAGESNRWTILSVEEIQKEEEKKENNLENDNEATDSQQEIKQDQHIYQHPVCYGNLTTEEFDAIINESLNDYYEGRVYTVDEVEAHLRDILK